MSEYRPLKFWELAEHQMPIPKNTREPAPYLAAPYFDRCTGEISGRFGDCVLHEQIVIPYPCCKVLSKEQRSRLKE